MNERGQAGVLTVIVSAIILGILTIVGAFVFRGASQATASQLASDRAKSSLSQLVQTAHAEASTAEAVFVPSQDIFGHANGYAFGTSNPLAAATTGGIVAPPATTGHEIDFYAKDAQHQGHFWAYVFQNGEVAKYTYASRNANGVAQGVASAPSWAMPASSFQAYYLYASQIPAVNGFVSANYHGSLPNVLVPLGYPEVYAGNRLAVFDIQASPTNAQLARHVELLAGTAVGSSTLNVSYTPPPLGATLAVAPTPLRLGYNGAQGLPATGTFSASLANYHHPFTVSACSVATIGVANQSITAPGNTTTYAVTPTAVGACTVTVATQSGLQPPDNVVQSAQEQIVVAGQLSVNPGSLAFSSPTAPTQSATVNEPGYSGAFSVPANTCGGYAALSGGGNGPSAGYGVTPQAPTSGCSITFSDVYGATGSLGVTVAATPAPTPVPTAAPTPTRTFTVTPTSVTFLSPTAPTQNVHATESGYTATISDTSDTCATSGYATVSPSSQSGVNGSPVSFTVTPNSALNNASRVSCSFTLADGVGSQTVSVTIDPPPFATPCTLDSYGYCVTGASGASHYTNNYCWILGPGGVSHRVIWVTGYGAYIYDVYNAFALLYTDTKTTTITVITPGCPPTLQATVTWSPGEPKVQTGDPNLP